MKIGILTSGGDAPGMNAVIRAIVKVSTKYGIETFGRKGDIQDFLMKKYTN